MALLRDFGVGRHDLNPQNSQLFLRFKSNFRLACRAEALERRRKLTQNLSFVGAYYFIPIYTDSSYFYLIARLQFR